MSCDRCGRPTTRPRLCRNCARDARREDRDHDDDLADCPECGGPTSAPGVVCYLCRGDAS